MPATTQAIRLAPRRSAHRQSKVRSQFNILVQKLETERVKLAHWRAEVPKIQALETGELLPLIQAFDERARQLIFQYDRTWADPALGRRDRDTLSELICEMALDFIERGDDDEAVRTVCDKHSAGAFDLGDTEEGKALMIDIIRAETGIALDADTDFSSPQALFEAMRARLAAQDAGQDVHQRARMSTREARLHAEENKLKQSVRDIFRKLASALHPDRATDPAERARKTDLMQRVNVAYTANDLLGLLELQREVEQIDQAGLDSLGDDRIKQYNRLLEGQIHGIRTDIKELQAALAFAMGLDPGQCRTPRAMLGSLRTEIKHMRDDVKCIEDQARRHADIGQLKGWLKHYRLHGLDSDVDEPWC